MKKRQTVLVGQSAEAILVSVWGMGSMNNARPIYDYICKYCKGPRSRLYFHLDNCSGMDSTFMGTLLKCHQELQEEGKSMSVICNSDTLKAKMGELGILQLIDIVDSAPLEGYKLEELSLDVDGKLRMSLILDAHERLADQSDENEKAFRSFIDHLSKDVKSDTK